MPGPYPGRVVSVHHPGSIIDDKFQAEPVQQMIDRGMMELTHAEHPTEAAYQGLEAGTVKGPELALVMGPTAPQHGPPAAVPEAAQQAA